MAEPGDGFEAYDVEIVDVLDLSRELRTDIADWDERFQTTLNYDDPPSSGFPTPEGEATWLGEGRELAIRLRAEVPGRMSRTALIGGKMIMLDDLEAPGR